MIATVPIDPRTSCCIVTPNRPYRITSYPIIRCKQDSRYIYGGDFRGTVSYLLDVVVAQGAAILKLLTSEDKTLLIRGDTLLVLDLGLDVVDGVARLDVEGNGLTRQGLDETVIRAWSVSSSFLLSMFVAGPYLTGGSRCQGLWRDLHLHCRDAEKTPC